MEAGMDARLGGRPVDIVVQSSIPVEMLIANIGASFKRNSPRFASLPDLGKGTGPCAIVAGGPSLNDELSKLYTFPGPIIACGTVHDHLVQNGITPDYAVFVDPDPIIAKYLTCPNKNVCYLVASQCDEAVFAKLANYDIRMWHAYAANKDTWNEITDYHGEPTIPGGDNVVLRAWPIASVLGHRDIHFYGFDCSFPIDCKSQHAYDYDWVVEDPIGVTHEATGKRYISAPGWLAQLNVFMKMLALGVGQFNITIHGDNLVAAMCCKPSR
jgi:hypothetical protein